MVSARIITLFYLLVINQANNGFSIFFGHNFPLIVDHMSNKISPSILSETCMSFVKMLVSCVMMRLLIQQNRIFASPTLAPSMLNV